MARKYRIISGYSHLDLPPERWTGRVPAKWQGCIPCPVKLPNGNEMVIMENRWPRASAYKPSTGTGYGRVGVVPSVYDRPGTGSPEERMREQDRAGVDAEILYTDLYSRAFLAMVVSQDGEDAELMQAHPVFRGFWRGVREDAGYKALIRAYNEFLAQEYCAANPHRLIAMGVIPDTGIDDAIAEMEYCAGAGLMGVALYRFPSGKGYPTWEDDRFWRAALDRNVPITFHIQGGATAFRQEQALLWGGERDPVSRLPRFGVEHPITPLQMAYAGVFDRFPELRIYWVGTQARWLPYAICEIDEDYAPDCHWEERFFGIEPMAHPPSYYFKTHFWGFMSEPHAVRMRHDVGVAQLIWGSDFGRARGGGLGAADLIERSFAGVPEDERHRMLAGNVVEFFHLGDEVSESGQTTRGVAHEQ